MSEASYLAQAYALLAHLNNDELKDILNDESKFMAIMKDDVKLTGDLSAEREVHMVSNKSLTEYNLPFEQRFEECKYKLAATYQECGVEQEKAIAKLAQLKEKICLNDSEDVTSFLQSDINRLEEEAEKLSESFLNGDVIIDTFIEQYTALRRNLIMNKIKLEKVSEMLKRRAVRKSSTHSIAPVSSSPYLVSGAANPISNAVYPGLSYNQNPAPYSTASYYMPMPGASYHGVRY